MRWTDRTLKLNQRDGFHSPGGSAGHNSVTCALSQTGWGTDWQRDEEKQERQREWETETGWEGVKGGERDVARREWQPRQYVCAENCFISRSSSDPDRAKWHETCGRQLKTGKKNPSKHVEWCKSLLSQSATKRVITSKFRSSSDLSEFEMLTFNCSAPTTPRFVIVLNGRKRCLHASFVKVCPKSDLRHHIWEKKPLIASRRPSFQHFIPRRDILSKSCDWSNAAVTLRALSIGWYDLFSSWYSGQW